MQNWCLLPEKIQWMSSHLWCGILWKNWPKQSFSEEMLKTDWIILSLKVNVWWCGEADWSVLSLKQSLAHYSDLIKRCSFYFLSYALGMEACDWDGGFSQAPKKERHPGKKCKSVYVGIREERGIGGMTGFHVRKWSSSLRTPAGVGVEGRLTASFVSGNLPCFQQSEKNILFITIEKCFCTYSTCKWVLQYHLVEGYLKVRGYV